MHNFRFIQEVSIAATYCSALACVERNGGSRGVSKVSMDTPHIDEFAVEFLYIYICISRTSCRKSYPALILRVLASFIN